MGKNQLAKLLVVVVFISGVISVALAFRYTFSSREFRRLQPQVMGINSRLNLAQSLLNDTLEYSKRNPAIDPLLYSLKLKTNTTGALPAPAQAPGN